MIAQKVTQHADINGLTVGQLIERLKGFKPSTPVYLELFESISDDGSATSQVSELIGCSWHTDQDVDQILLQGCPKHLHEKMRAFEFLD